jgi:hypothetical protein
MWDVRIQERKIKNIISKDVKETIGEFQGWKYWGYKIFIIHHSQSLMQPKVGIGRRICS